MKYLASAVVLMSSILSFGQNDTEVIYEGQGYALLDTVVQLTPYEQTILEQRAIAATYGIPFHSDEDIQRKMSLIPSEIPLNYTPEIASIIRRYVYTKREYLERMLTLSTVYFPIFEEVFLLKRMPLELKYLAVVESALKPAARSRVGATGLWQFMPATAKMEGLKINSYLDERRDIYKSTEFAAQHLSRLHRIHGGDWFLALAAYNSGSGNVSKAMRNSGGYDFWTIKHKLPRETQGYVPAFIAVFYCMYYANEYGLFPSKPAFDFAKTTREKIYDQVSMKYICELIGSCEAEMAQYNPSLNKGIIPSTYDGFDLVLPRQYLMAFNSNKHLLTSDPYLNAPIENDQNNADESLIADHTSRSVSETQPKNNELDYQTYTKDAAGNKHYVQPKAEPAKQLKDIYSQVVLNSSQESSDMQNTSTTISNSRNFEENYKIEKVSETNIVATSYKVKRGENLTQIARGQGVKLDDIKKWNNLQSSENLYTGKLLTIFREVTEVKPQYVSKSHQSIRSNPMSFASKPAGQYQSNQMNVEYRTSDPKFITHKIKKGETLMALTRTYGCTLAQLKDWNRLTSMNTIIGQEIKIFTNTDHLESASIEPNESKEAKPLIKSYSYFEAQPGDTLQTASAKFGIPLEVLKSLNNRGENEPFNEGEKIKIPSL